MKLIERNKSNQCSIKESKGRYYVEGLIFECDKPNANNRIYPKALVEKEFDRIRRDMDSGRKIKTILDHTDSNGEKLSSYLGTLQSFAWSGKAVYGRASLADTIATKTLLEISKEGLPYGFSPESLGDLTDYGNHKIVSNLKIINLAVVSNPSNESQAKVLAEAIEKMRKETSFNECLEENLRRLIKENQPLSNKVVDPFIRLVVNQSKLNESKEVFTFTDRIDYEAIVRGGR